MRPRDIHPGRVYIRQDGTRLEVRQIEDRRVQFWAQSEGPRGGWGFWVLPLGHFARSVVAEELQAQAQNSSEEVNQDD